MLAPLLCQFYPIEMHAGVLSLNAVLVASGNLNQSTNKPLLWFNLQGFSDGWCDSVLLPQKKLLRIELWMFFIFLSSDYHWLSLRSIIVLYFTFKRRYIKVYLSPCFIKFYPQQNKNKRHKLFFLSSYNQHHFMFEFTTKCGFTESSVIPHIRNYRSVTY